MILYVIPQSVIFQRHDLIFGQFLPLLIETDTVNYAS